jgi:Arc/MetJ family transcription regulator
VEIRHAWNVEKYVILTDRGSNIKTNREMDDELVKRAMRRAGVLSKKAVRADLRLLIQTHSQTRIRKLRGKVKWEGNLNDSRR